MNLIISKDADQLSRHFADWLVSDIRNVLTTAERYTIALSGGSTPKKLFRILREPAYARQIEWKKIHFFWGDERFVPFTDERNNARMTFDELLDHVPVVKEQVHIMPTGMEPDEARVAYEQVLHQYFKGEATFDLVMLGMGPDAHTLSLFPGYPVINEQAQWVSTFYLKEQEMHRITLTTAVVNRAAKIAFLVAGPDKAMALRQVLEGGRNPILFPSQVINPASGDLSWYVDLAAAADLGPATKRNAQRL